MRKQPNAPKKLPPKPASTGAPSALDEVERALSVLDGRHPDFVRAERETREAARVREQTLKAERARAWWKRAKATMLTLALLGAIAAVGWLGLRVFSLARAFSAALDAASAPFVGDGFAALAASNLVTPHKLEAQASAQTCFVAVTSAPTGDMIVTHGTSVTSHAHSIGWCACEAERVVVTAPTGAGPTQGVRLYTIDARVLGGPQGWGFASARPDALTPGGDECQERELVSWIADRRFPREAVDATWLERGAGARLSEAGFQAVAGASVGRTFAVVEAMSGSCVFALRPEAQSQADLVLEDMGGTALARGGSLLWCDLHGRALTVRSSGAATVLVVAAPASRVGGLLGAREWTARVRVPDPTTWASEEDLALDAVNTLRASALPDVTVAPLQQPQIRFVGLSMRTTKALVRDAPPHGTMLACSPSLESNRLESVCAQVGPQPWLAAAGETVGLAGAPAPFWLAALEDHLDHDALLADLKLLALARRLTSERFEVTMFSGVTELASGRIAVLGGAHDDAVVAVEIATAPPWVMPYSDRAPWPLDGDPREVPLAPGDRVTLTATPRPDADPKQRRTIVFRRAHLP